VWFGTDVSEESAASIFKAKGKLQMVLMYTRYTEASLDFKAIFCAIKFVK